MLLHHAGLQFEDIRLSHSDFKKMKDEGKLEFKMLPVLELPNGKFYSQSQAIKTMLATELGFYPKFTKQTQKSQGNQELEEQKLNQQTSQETTQKSILEGYEIDSILEVNNEICDKYWLMEIEKDPQRLEQDINIYIEIDLRNYFKALNGRIEKLGSSTDIDHYFLVGNKLTIADFDSTALAYTLWLNENNKFFEIQNQEVQKYPKLLKYYEVMRGHIFKEYFQQRNNKLPL
eukprot:403349926